jgi:hypothetical protein
MKSDYTLEELSAYTRRQTVERLRKRLPPGTRIVLLRMDDPQAPPVGTKGTVRGVDDMADILVSWDNGSGLNLVYGVDNYSKLVNESDGEPSVSSCPKA